MVLGSGIDMLCGWLFMIDVKFSQGGSEESRSRVAGIGPSRKKEGWGSVVFKSKVCAWL